MLDVFLKQASFCGLLNKDFLNLGHTARRGQGQPSLLFLRNR